MAQHQPLLVRKQFHDNNRSIEDAMLVNLASGGKKHATPWREARVAPAIRPFVLMPEVWELNTNRAIPTVDPARRQLDFEMTAHGDLLLSLTFRVKAPAPFPTATSATKDNGLITYPPSLVLSLIHRAEMWVGRTLVERLEPEYIHLWQRLALRNPPVEAQGRVGDETPHDGKPVDQYVVLPFFFHRGQCPLPIQKIRDNCGGRLGGAEGGIRLRIFLRDLAQICPSLSKEPGTLDPPELATSYDDFEFQVIGKTALLGDDEARHVRKAEFAAVVPHVQSLHHDEEGSTMRPSHQITELPLRVERPLTRLLWAVRDKQVMPDAQGSHTYAQGVRTLAGPPIQPELGDFNKARTGVNLPSVQTADVNAAVQGSTELLLENQDGLTKVVFTDDVSSSDVTSVGLHNTKMNLFDDHFDTALVVLAKDSEGNNVAVSSQNPVLIKYKPAAESAALVPAEIVLTNHTTNDQQFRVDFFGDVHDLANIWHAGATLINVYGYNEGDEAMQDLNAQYAVSTDTSISPITTTFITLSFTIALPFDEYIIEITGNTNASTYFNVPLENIGGKDGIFLSKLQINDAQGNVIVGTTRAPQESEIIIEGGEETYGVHANAISSRLVDFGVLADNNSSDSDSHMVFSRPDANPITIIYQPQQPSTIKALRASVKETSNLAYFLGIFESVSGVRDDGTKVTLTGTSSPLQDGTDLASVVRFDIDGDKVEEFASYEITMTSPLSKYPENHPTRFFLRNYPVNAITSVSPLKLNVTSTQLSIANATVYSGSLSNLVDDSLYSSIIQLQTIGGGFEHLVSGQDPPIMLIYDHGAPVVINTYRLFRSTNEDYPVRWRFEGSEDSSNWTLLDDTFASSDEPRRNTYSSSDPDVANNLDVEATFNTENNHYRYYRWVFTKSLYDDGESNFVVLAEIQLFSNEPVKIPLAAGSFSYTGSVTTNNTDLLRDNDLSVQVLVDVQNNDTITYDHGSNIVINKYKLFRLAGSFLLTNWLFEASTDNSTWTELDHSFALHSDLAGVTTSPQYTGTNADENTDVVATFNAANASYRYYRWTFQKAVDQKWGVVSEIQLFSGFVPTTTDVVNNYVLGDLEFVKPDFTVNSIGMDVATSRLDMGPGSLHLWGDRFDFRTTDAQGNELVDPLEHVQLKLDAQDRLPDDSNMRVAYYRLVDPHEHASRSQGQQPGAYSYTFARDADSLSREGPERAVTGSINLARIHDKVLRLKHRVPGRDAVLFAWAECLDVFELGSGLGSYGMRHA